MKKLLTWAAPALMASMIFVGCQKNIDSVSEDGLRDGTRSLANQTYTSCESQCIDLDEESVVYYEKIYTESYTTPVPAPVTVTIYNTENKIWYKVSSPDAGIKYLKIGDDVIYNYGQNDNTSNGVLSGQKSYDLTEGWEACDLMSKTIVIRRNQQNPEGNAEKELTFNTTYNLIGICDDCEYSGNTFGGVATSCIVSSPPAAGRVAEYTFSSEDGVSYFKMQGGLTNFTGQNATVFVNGVEVVFDGVSDDGWAQGTAAGFTVGQRTPGGSSNRNIRIEGSLGECSQVVVRVLWNADNSGSTITGGWSVVDAIGVELAPEVLGLSCN